MATVAMIRGRFTVGAIRAFCGPAGSGKTYALIGETGRLARQVIRFPTQNILALTFMHGARRRLHARLASLRGTGIPVTCETIDSFCLRMVNRFRAHIGRDLPVTVSLRKKCRGWLRQKRSWDVSIDCLRRMAVCLLERDSVTSLIAASYPVVVVDEFQDCAGDLLEIVKRLSRQTDIVVAADSFQLLNSDSGCCAVDWLDQYAEVTHLDGNHRTESNLLRSTAAAIRNGVAASECIDVHLLDGPGLAAWTISKTLAWGNLKGSTSRVVISPVRAQSSPWVQNVMSSLAKSLGKQKKVGPYRFTWEATEEEELESLLPAIQGLDGGADGIRHQTLRQCLTSERRIIRQAASQGIRLLSVRGENDLSRDEFVDIVSRCSHAASAFGPERPGVRKAMTVHGAKNREFDYVFVLWPYEIRSDVLLRRKLLYNAVTRARLNAVLLVQGGTSRLEKDEVLLLLRSGVKEVSKRSAGK
jgi:superfamily I DNA/RNA helicase